jgi:hypothetical protein
MKPLIVAFTTLTLIAGVATPVPSSTLVSASTTPPALPSTGRATSTSPTPATTAW